MANPRPSVKGRTRGVPNRVSTARVERVLAEGRKLPPDELLRNAEDCREQAARYAPLRMNRDTEQCEANPDYNDGDYHRWLAAERDALKAAAPYYAPRLVAMAIQNNLQVDEDDHGDPRQVMWEIYKQMREREEISLKAPVPPPAKANGDERQSGMIEQPIQEDDGDGVAT
jgi:hypothetical protein